jgi:hypothetical protein
MDRKSDEPLSRAIMRASGWCDGDGGHDTGTHMVSTETLMEWAAKAVLLEEAARPQTPAITEYRPNPPFVSTCTTHVERNAR